MNLVATATDKSGNALLPGDKVSFKTYPRGTARGEIIISEKTLEVMQDGTLAKSLAIKSESGAIYPLYTKGVRKLS
jgi:hypothetical protein